MNSMKQSTKGFLDSKSEALKWRVCALAGFISLYTLYIGFIEAVIFEGLYENMRYTFFVTVPSYVAVIPAMILTSLTSKMSVIKQVYIGAIGIGVGLTGVALTPFMSSDHNSACRRFLP